MAQKSGDEVVREKFTYHCKPHTHGILQSISEQIFYGSQFGWVHIIGVDDSIPVCISISPYLHHWESPVIQCLYFLGSTQYTYVKQGVEYISISARNRTSARISRILTAYLNASPHLSVTSFASWLPPDSLIGKP